MTSEMQLLKVTDRRRLANKVQEQLREKPEVRPFPAAVTQLVSACQDPNATAATFEKIIQTDASLAARLLRMANSPLYGISQEVTSVGHAAAVLGVRQLRNLAFALAGASMFKEGSTASGQRQQLWNHSLGCATTCRLLAKTAIGVDPEEAFLGRDFSRRWQAVSARHRSGRIRRIDASLSRRSPGRGRKEYLRRHS